MKYQIIFPMGLYVFYIFAVALYMFMSRLQAIKDNKVSIKYFKYFAGEPPPDQAVLVARHYDNQFQVPLLFLVTGVLHFSMGLVNQTTILLAWAFVFSRIGHSWIHLGSNNVQHRAIFFAAGWILILLLWVQLVYFAF